MTNPLQDLLSTRDWLLADGATGTNLFNMGLESGDPPEFWNETKPDNIRALYRGAVEAGSDLFLTNAFGANAIGFEGPKHRIFDEPGALAIVCDREHRRARTGRDGRGR